MSTANPPPTPDAEIDLAGIRAALSADTDALRLKIERDGEVVQRIELGVTVDGVTFGRGSTIVATEQRDVREQFVMLTGKVAGERTATHRELVVELLDGGTGRSWGLVVRVANDGVAFRYRMPFDVESVALGPELTVLELSHADRLWTLDYQTWYETPRFSSLVSALPAGDYGFPTLVERDAAWLLFSEAAIDGRSSGAHLRIETDRAHVVPADETSSVAAGHQTPWRVAIIGDLATVVASQLVDELSPARDGHDYAFVRPGRAAWSWWSSQYSGADLDEQKRFTDFAAARGWEHVLVDCGWDAAWVPELVEHASRRGVQVHLWSSWSDLDGPEALSKLGVWASWGVAGIKVDFMESESRERYRWYDAIIAESARVGLMVNFHGSVIPRGWARTHPHVVSYEGIRGAEYYVFYGTPLTAAHNVIQPFTRNVVGSMDYTPVAFSAPERETSEAHELALAVVYESGVTHFADDPSQYESRPPALTLLTEIAPRWDEIRLLGGHPDREAVIARRAEDRWFVAAIATGEAREIELDLRDLVPGALQSWFVVDDRGGLGEFRSSERFLRLPVAANGGFAGIVTASDAPLFRAQPARVADTPTIEPSIATISRGGSITLAASPGAHLTVEPGWSAIQDDGGWRIGTPPDIRPGSVGVVTARISGKPDLIGHARLFVERDDEQTLSDLAFLAARNAVGPVERDLSNGGGDPRDGRPATIGGRTFARAIGVSESSHVEFWIGGQASRLCGSVGIDDETPGATAVAEVAVDGHVLRTMRLAAGEVHDFDVDLGRGNVLALSTSCDDADVPAHVDWVDTAIVRSR